MNSIQGVSVALIIPTRNASHYLKELLTSIDAQTININELLVIDSESSDDTVSQLNRHGKSSIVSIKAQDFNHGGTRKLACSLTKSDILIFMTQDAILANKDSLQRLVVSIADFPSVGCAYGRQLPHRDAKLLGSHGRLFNYPPVSKTKTMDDIAELGIKTCFSSDSFAAYRRTALEDVGGFPPDVIGSEDSYVAGKMLLKGWAIRYESEAMVYHSHDYTILEEFKRYFDIGVFYGREAWIKQHFGTAGNEGVKFVVSELKSIIQKRAFNILLQYPLRILMKALGYRLGKLEQLLPSSFKRCISMFPGYWK